MCRSRCARREHYANVFDTVEIDDTFSRLPEKTTFISGPPRLKLDRDRLEYFLQVFETDD